MTHHRKPYSDWPAVPGTKERAPLIEIVIFVVVCAVLLGALVGTALGFVLTLAGAVS